MRERVSNCVEAIELPDGIAGDIQDTQTNQSIQALQPLNAKSFQSENLDGRHVEVAGREFDQIV